MTIILAKQFQELFLAELDLIENPDERNRVSNIIRSINGCQCKRCNELNEYAEPNQSDGSYICYRCRT